RGPILTAVLLAEIGEVRCRFPTPGPCSQSQPWLPLLSGSLEIARLWLNRDAHRVRASRLRERRTSREVGHARERQCRPHRLSLADQTVHRPEGRVAVRSEGTSPRSR